MARIGSFVSGKARLQQYNWNSCKVAHLREDAAEAQRPRLGRPKNTSTNVPKPTELSEGHDAASKVNNSPAESKQKRRGRPRGRKKKQESETNQTSESGNIQNNEPTVPETPTPSPVSDEPDNPTWSPRPGPGNCNFGPVITREMYDQWGSVVSRPTRSTRNKNPQYIDSLSF